MIISVTVWDFALRSVTKRPETNRMNDWSNCFWPGFGSCCLLEIVGSEESSSSPVVRSGEGGGGGGSGSASNSSARKKKYAPNEQGRYVCTQCGRSYAAYHVILLLFLFFIYFAVFLIFNSTIFLWGIFFISFLIFFLLKNCDVDGQNSRTWCGTCATNADFLRGFRATFAAVSFAAKMTCSATSHAFTASWTVRPGCF